MNRNTKIVLIIVGVAIFLSVGTTFYRYYVLRDYLVHAEVACDPQKENCFVRYCTVDDWDPCDFLHVKYTRYYKIVAKLASNIPVCNQNKQQCAPLTCDPLEKNCQVITCTEGYNDDSCSDVTATSTPSDPGVQNESN